MTGGLGDGPTFPDFRTTPGDLLSRHLPCRGPSCAPHVAPSPCRSPRLLRWPQGQVHSRKLTPLGSMKSSITRGAVKVEVGDS